MTGTPPTKKHRGNQGSKGRAGTGCWTGASTFNQQPSLKSYFPSSGEGSADGPTVLGAISSCSCRGQWGDPEASYRGGGLFKLLMVSDSLRLRKRCRMGEGGWVGSDHPPSLIRHKYFKWQQLQQQVQVLTLPPRHTWGIFTSQTSRPPTATSPARRWDTGPWLRTGRNLGDSRRRRRRFIRGWTLHGLSEPIQDASNRSGSGKAAHKSVTCVVFFSWKRTCEAGQNPSR